MPQQPYSAGALRARRISTTRFAVFGARAKIRTTKRANELFLGTPGYVAPLTGLTGPLADLNGQLPLSIRRQGSGSGDDKFIVKVQRNENHLELLLVLKNFDLDHGMMLDNCKEKRRKKTKQSMANKHTIQQTCNAVVSKLCERSNQIGVMKAFAKFDSDHSGSVDKTEFLAGLRSVGITELSTDEFDVVWPMFDVDGSGEVDLNEFASFLEKGSRTHAEYSSYREHVYDKSVRMSKASRERRVQRHSVRLQQERGELVPETLDDKGNASKDLSSSCELSPPPSPCTPSQRRFRRRTSTHGQSALARAKVTGGILAPYSSKKIHTDLSDAHEQYKKVLEKREAQHAKKQLESEQKAKLINRAVSEYKTPALTPKMATSKKLNKKVNPKSREKIEQPKKKLKRGAELYKGLDSKSREKIEQPKEKLKRGAEPYKVLDAKSRKKIEQPKEKLKPGAEPYKLLDPVGLTLGSMSIIQSQLALQGINPKLGKPIIHVSGPSEMAKKNFCRDFSCAEPTSKRVMEMSATHLGDSFPLASPMPIQVRGQYFGGVSLYSEFRMRCLLNYSTTEAAWATFENIAGSKKGKIYRSDFAKILSLLELAPNPKQAEDLRLQIDKQNNKYFTLRNFKAFMKEFEDAGPAVVKVLNRVRPVNDANVNVRGRQKQIQNKRTKHVLSLLRRSRHARPNSPRRASITQSVMHKVSSVGATTSASKLLQSPVMYRPSSASLAPNCNQSKFLLDMSVDSTEMSAAANVEFNDKALAAKRRDSAARIQAVVRGNAGRLDVFWLQQKEQRMKSKLRAAVRLAKPVKTRHVPKNEAKDESVASHAPPSDLSSTLSSTAKSALPDLSRPRKKHYLNNQPPPYSELVPQPRRPPRSASGRPSSQRHGNGLSHRAVRTWTSGPSRVALGLQQRLVGSALLAISVKVDRVS